jgi:hypothetical protein
LNPDLAGQKVSSFWQRAYSTYHTGIDYLIKKADDVSHEFYL